MVGAVGDECKAGHWVTVFYPSLEDCWCPPDAEKVIQGSRASRKTAERCLQNPKRCSQGLGAGIKTEARKATGDLWTVEVGWALGSQDELQKVHVMWQQEVEYGGGPG